MIWLLAGFVVVTVAMIMAPRRSQRRKPPSTADTPPADLEPLDQLALLQRYGTSDDAARLISEGRGDDLAGLGYRPEQ